MIWSVSTLIRSSGATRPRCTVNGFIAYPCSPTSILDIRRRRRGRHHGRLFIPVEELHLISLSVGIMHHHNCSFRLYRYRYARRGFLQDDNIILMQHRGSPTETSSSEYP